MTKTEDNPMHLKTREPSRLRRAPRCLARTRRGGHATRRVATRKASMIARNASAKASVEASRSARCQAMLCFKP
jgi:hypothetical protein